MIGYKKTSTSKQANFMKKAFDNEERRRYYGLRVGDIVRSKMYGFDNAKVVEYGFLDNNSVIVRVPGEADRDVVAEWCEIVTKVEDISPE
jgi:hypothetical protein